MVDGYLSLEFGEKNTLLQYLVNHITQTNNVETYFFETLSYLFLRISKTLLE